MQRENVAHYFRSRVLALIIALASVVLLPQGCASLLERPEFSHETQFKSSSESTSRAEGDIDTGPTYELFIILPLAEGRLRLSMTGELRDPDAEEKEQLLFYSVEKYYSLSTDEDETQLYTPLARNYTTDWTAQAEITLASSSSDPLIQLTPGIYRLRFTSFTKEPFSYTLSIGTNAGIPLTAKTFKEGIEKYYRSQNDATGAEEKE